MLVCLYVLASSLYLGLVLAVPSLQTDNLDPFGRKIIDFAFFSPGSNTLLKIGSKDNTIYLSSKLGKIIILQAGDSANEPYIQTYKHIYTDKQTNLQI